MAVPNLTEIATTTIDHRSRTLADNVTDNSALLSRLKKRGKRQTASGGITILEELSYAENQTFQWFSGYDVIDNRPSNTMSSAQYAWREAVVTVTINKLEELQNSGREQMINLLSSRIENAEETFVNNMSKGVYSDGTGNGGKQITGLKAAIPSVANAGKYGNIDRAMHAFWRPQTVTGVTGAANIKDKMAELWVRLCRNMDKPDLICTNNLMYRYFWAALGEQQRFTQPSVGQMGFTSLKFLSADVILDGGVGGPLTETDIIMYFINTKYLKYRPHAQADVIALPPVESVNQAAMARRIYWAGNITCSNQMLQGRLQGA